MKYLHLSVTLDVLRPEIKFALCPVPCAWQAVVRLVENQFRHEAPHKPTLSLQINTQFHLIKTQNWRSPSSQQ